MYFKNKKTKNSIKNNNYYILPLTNRRDKISTFLINPERLTYACHFKLLKNIIATLGVKLWRSKNGFN